MADRSPFNDESQFALWNSKRFRTRPGDRCEVLVAHGNRAIGESIALLLRLTGFLAVARADIKTVELTLEHWRPGALLFDTALGRKNGFRTIRRFASDPMFSRVLVVAMTHEYDERSPAEIRRLGFDGLCRYPCPLWMLTDMLTDHCPPLL